MNWIEKFFEKLIKLICPDTYFCYLYFVDKIILCSLRFIKDKNIIVFKEQTMYFKNNVAISSLTLRRRIINVRFSGWVFHKKSNKSINS